MGLEVGSGHRIHTLPAELIHALRSAAGPAEPWNPRGQTLPDVLEKEGVQALNVRTLHFLCSHEAKDVRVAVGNLLSRDPSPHLVKAVVTNLCTLGAQKVISAKDVAQADLLVMIYLRQCGEIQGISKLEGVSLASIKTLSEANASEEKEKPSSLDIVGFAAGARTPSILMRLTSALEYTATHGRGRTSAARIANIVAAGLTAEDLTTAKGQLLAAQLARTVQAQSDIATKRVPHIYPLMDAFLVERISQAIKLPSSLSGSGSATLRHLMVDYALCGSSRACAVCHQLGLERIFADRLGQQFEKLVAQTSEQQQDERTRIRSGQFKVIGLALFNLLEITKDKEIRTWGKELLGRICMCNPDAPMVQSGIFSATDARVALFASAFKELIRPGTYLTPITEWLGSGGAAAAKPLQFNEFRRNEARLEEMAVEGLSKKAKGIVAAVRTAAADAVAMGEHGGLAAMNLLHATGHVANDTNHVDSEVQRRCYQANRDAVSEVITNALVKFAKATRDQDSTKLASGSTGKLTEGIRALLRYFPDQEKVLVVAENEARKSLSAEPRWARCVVPTIQLKLSLAARVAVVAKAIVRPFGRGMKRRIE